MSLQPVILSGGSGTRLWPLSREAYPKQFLALTGPHTMLQETARRLDGLAEEHPRQTLHVLDPIVVCNEDHRFLVAEQFRVLEREAAANGFKRVAGVDEAGRGPLAGPVVAAAVIFPPWSEQLAAALDGELP